LTWIKRRSSVKHMFERFTGEARQAIVLAQEEARRLQHNYIGTEHILLGLLDPEQGGVAAQAAERFGLTLAVGRQDVLDIIGAGKQPVKTGHIPFTPRAKKCLELALREALQLNDDYIGTEHILLGIVREGDGVAAKILEQHATSLGEVTAAVTDLHPPSGTAQSRRWLRRPAGQRTALARQREFARELRTTPAADTSLADAARLAGSSPVGSHHILLAALADADSAAARALAGLGVDIGRVREALRTADVTGSSDELPEDAGRRQMTVTVTSDRLTLDVFDPAIVQLGQAAVDALAGRRAEPGERSESREAHPGGVIRGDDPHTSSLGLVWQSLHNSLEDMRGRAQRAAATGETTPAPPGQSGAADG
jgi:ATP-dependent Clp protease ATP-binding subunit ClpA